MQFFASESNSCFFCIGAQELLRFRGIPHPLSIIAIQGMPDLPFHFCGSLWQVLEEVLSYCTAQELGLLNCTSKFFNNDVTERIASLHLRDNPRFQVIEMGPKDTYARLMHFIDYSDDAIRHAVNVSLGAYHTSVVGSISALATADGDEDDVPVVRDLSDMARHVAESASRAECTASGRELFTFGRGFHGQLGLGGYESAPAPTSVALDKVLRDAECETKEGLEVVSCGGSHCAALAPNGRLFTWGLANSGELGHGGWTPIDVEVPRLVSSLVNVKITQVSAGSNHTLAVSDFGGLWTCGRGRHGQLGRGHFHDAGPLQRLEALRGMQVLFAVAGGSHSLCLTEGGSVWSWGDCRFGQLGLGDVSFVVSAGWDSGVPWPCLVESLTDLDEPVVHMAAGRHHTLFITASGKLLACGRGRHGALGAGGDRVRHGAHGVTTSSPPNKLAPSEVPIRHKPPPRNAPISEPGAAVDVRGRGARRGASGPAGASRVAQCPCGPQCRVAHADAGGSHSCVLTACGAVFTSGSNSYGQLGHGDTRKRYAYERVESLRGKRVSAVVCGEDHSGAVGRAGELYLWGRGDWGQCGTGDNRSHWQPKRVPGVAVAPAKSSSDITERR